jgi:hypothetical protein
LRAGTDGKIEVIDFIEDKGLGFCGDFKRSQKGEWFTENRKV